MNGIERPFTASIKFKKKNQINSYLSTDNIYKISLLKRESKQKLNSGFQINQISLSKRSRNNNIYVNPSSIKCFKNIHFKNLNSDTLHSIFSQENSGNFFDCYSNNFINKKDYETNTSFKSTNSTNKIKRKINIKNLKKNNDSHISLIKTLGRNNKNNINNYNDINNYNYNKNNLKDINSLKKIKKVKRFSLLDKYMLKINNPEEIFEDFIDYANPIKASDKYVRFKNQLKENRNKIDKMIHHIDIKIVKKNKKLLSFTPDMLKKRYFLKAIYNKKNK
jgi:hypothetical protein